MLWEKENLLVTSNFFSSQSVFQRLVLQACKNKGLFWIGLSNRQQFKNDKIRVKIFKFNSIFR